MAISEKDPTLSEILHTRFNAVEANKKVSIILWL